MNISVKITQPLGTLGSLFLSVRSREYFPFIEYQMFDRMDVGGLSGTEVRNVFYKCWFQWHKFESDD